jgi:hypothetical protein
MASATASNSDLNPSMKTGPTTQRAVVARRDDELERWRGARRRGATYR